MAAPSSATRVGLFSCSDVRRRGCDHLREDLRPNLAVLLSAGSAVALISTLSLPLPVAIASSLLGALMIAGAEVDAGRICFLILSPGAASH